MVIEELKCECGARVLVWRLEEKASRLVDLCRETGIAVEGLMDMPEKRQREKAAELLLLCRAFGRPVTLCHDGQGAPSVEGEAVNISITHTPRLVALALDDCHVIGIDAEQADRQQVIRVRNKFLNASEQQFISADDIQSHVIAWTAKEAIIKAERNSALDWTDGIRLEPFVLGVPMIGNLILAACCEGHRYRLTVRMMENHFITLAVPCIP